MNIRTFRVHFRDGTRHWVQDVTEWGSDGAWFVFTKIDGLQTTINQHDVFMLEELYPSERTDD